MKGVEILSSTEMIVEYSYNDIYFWITFMCVIIAAIVIEGFKLEEDVKFGWRFGCLFLGVALACLLREMSAIPSAYETQYEVRVSDEVSLIEFIDKYEIIDQQGQVYKVKERNN